MIICDIVAAPSHDDCLSLCRYLEKYWQAVVREEFDTGFAAKFLVSMPGRTIVLTHDSATGNALRSTNSRIDQVAADIIADLDQKLR